MRWILLAGGLLMGLCTRWGIGASPESATYIGAARNLLAGNGLSLTIGPGETAPMTHYPPLYSMLLAIPGLVGIEPLTAARVMGIVLFMATGGLVGYLIRVITRSRRLSLIGAFLFLTSVMAIEAYSQAWTEPLFLFFGFYGVYLLASYLDSSRRRVLLGSAVCIGLAFLARYVGGALIVTAGLAIVLIGSSWKRKALDGSLFLVVASFPMLIWMIRNLRLSGLATNREVGFHPPSLDSGDAMQTAVPFLFAIAAVWIRHRTPVADANGPGQRLAQVLILFIPVYMILLLISITSFDAYTPISNRILSPVYVAMLILGMDLVNRLKTGLDLRPNIRRVLQAIAVVLLLIHLGNTGVLVQDRFRNGTEYTGRIWHESRMLQYIGALDETGMIYSNGGFALSIWFDRPARLIPFRTRNPFLTEPNPDFEEEIEEMVRVIRETGGALAYFRSMERWWWPTEDALLERLPLVAVFEAEEGAVYILESDD